MIIELRINLEIIYEDLLALNRCFKYDLIKTNDKI